VHIPTGAVVDAPSLHGQRIGSLVSFAGRVVVALQDGGLQVFDSVQGCRHQFTLNDDLLALTLGLSEGEPLAWLALLRSDEHVRVVQLQLETGEAHAVWTSEWELAEEADVAMRWQSDPGALDLGAGDRLARMKRADGS
jgi:hypothetical protein